MTKRGRPRAPRPDLDAVLAARATGATWEEVAAQLGVKRQTVLRVLEEAGLKPADVPAGAALAAPSAPPAAAQPPPAAAAPAPPDDRARRLLHDPRLLLEEMAGMATAGGVPASQRFRALKAVQDAVLGKASAGQPLVGSAPAAEATPFDPTRLSPEKRQRYLEVLKAIDELEAEAEALRVEADGPG